MLDSVDSARLSKLIEDVKRFSIERMLETTLMGHTVDLDQRNLAIIAENCSFDHGGILVFPDAIQDVTDFVRSLGLDVRVPVPSVIVRERLSRRYNIVQDILDMSIVHATILNESGNHRGIEAFCLSRRTAQDASPAMVARERDENNEGHFALNVKNPDTEKLNTLRRVLRDRFSMRADGGGYNPYEDAERGGRSTLYFSLPRGGRLELTCIGNYSDVVASHLRTAMAHTPDTAPRPLRHTGPDHTAHWRVHRFPEGRATKERVRSKKPVDAPAQAV